MINRVYIAVIQKQSNFIPNEAHHIFSYDPYHQIFLLLSSRPLCISAIILPRRFFYMYGKLRIILFFKVKTNSGKHRAIPIILRLRLSARRIFRQTNQFRKNYDGTQWR